MEDEDLAILHHHYLHLPFLNIAILPSLLNQVFILLWTIMYWNNSVNSAL